VPNLWTGDGARGGVSIGCSGRVIVNNSALDSKLEQKWVSQCWKLGNGRDGESEECDYEERSLNKRLEENVDVIFYSLAYLQSTVGLAVRYPIAVQTFRSLLRAMAQWVRNKTS
jgi:hypothetical protein